MIWRKNMWKFKSWKGKDKCLFLVSMGVILCILAFPAERLNGKNPASAGVWPVSNGLGNTLSISQSTKNPSDGKIGSFEEDAAEAAAAVGTTYEAMLEKRVKEILKHVDGVGQVDVMIVLKSSAEKVIHMDSSISRSTTEENDAGGGTRKIENEEQEKTAVLTGNESSRSPIIEKELYPEISGMIISAAGGGDPTVCSEISAAMEALFDLPAHKIKVLKRVD